MSVAKLLVEELQGVRPLFDRLRSLADDRTFLGKFRDGVEFVEWFKSFISPVLRINYNTGTYWIRSTDIRGLSSGLDKARGTSGLRTRHWPRP
jgi:hypothetical protein